MSYGLQIMRSDGRVLFDSRSAMGGVFVGRLSLTPGNSGSMVFPGADLIGRTLMAVVLTPGMHSYSFDQDGAGQPRITWTSVSSAVPRETVLLLWAK